MKNEQPIDRAYQREILRQVLRSFGYRDGYLIPESRPDGVDNYSCVDAVVNTPDGRLRLAEVKRRTVQYNPYWISVRKIKDAIALAASVGADHAVELFVLWQDAGLIGATAIGPRDLEEYKVVVSGRRDRSVQDNPNDVERLIQIPLERFEMTPWSPPMQSPN